ncbi:hypothetical protein F4802DRAFT_618422 [Xylaria palmicola]|nr:hypothetical protein F4802DRAFT_618422 [Xylaria palmicola]
MSDPSSSPSLIAVVGIRFRLLDNVRTLDELGEVLCQQRDLSREVPRERFNANGFYHPDPKHHGTTNAPGAYWLNDNIRAFDAPFFNISPMEAEAMDPQQRQMLEVVNEVMDDAGFSTRQYSGEDVGVFAACMTQDYETLAARDPLTFSEYHSVGNSRALLANRISYFFNIRGLSESTDTACSSGLTALSRAMETLRSGRCRMACVTGANLMFSPDQFISESGLGLLSPQGKCHMWDTRADGYARGEAVIAILLKPLSAALADGDRVEAVIREVGVNADGKTEQITQPNPEAQTHLIRTTYKSGGLDSTDPSHRCQYFEAHGTGTKAGDPREATAIHNAFFGKPILDTDNIQSSADPGEKMLVGSIKSVVGHVEGAAGLAGVAKVIWCLQNKLVPPNLHFENLNPEIEPYYKHLHVPTALTPWPTSPPGQPRRASVNSFGFGGSNAHAIIEAYTPEIHGADPVAWSRPRSEGAAVPFRLPLVLTAASPKSLRDVVQSYKSYIEKNQDDLDLIILSWHQYARRSDLSYRIAISPTTAADALEALDSIMLSNESTIPASNAGRFKTTKSIPQILGVFTGQGAQWPTMSKSLLQQNSTYRDTIRNLDAVLRACHHPCSWTLEELIMAGRDESRIHEAAVSQPLCTALQIALVDTLRSIGVTFHTVIGHSSGEIAAAYAAGRLSAKDAIVIAYYRGMVAHLACGPSGEEGGMLAVNMSESEALTFCSNPLFNGRTSIAASNSPNSVTLSGDLEALHLAHKQLTDEQKTPKLLHVDTAYHSPHMTKPATEYLKLMRDYGISPATEGNGTVWVSSVRGRPRMVLPHELDPQYWADNMTNQVQFHEAVQFALTRADNAFDCTIEVGPHPQLQGPFTQTAIALDHPRLPYVCPLNRTKGDELSVSEFLGFMWSTFGPSSIDMSSYVEQSPVPGLVGSRLFNVPPYPFDHSVNHWRESRISRQYQARSDPPHELLGPRDREDNENIMKWRNILKPRLLPWLNDHCFQGQALLPASAYCVMALEAARVALGGRPASLVEIRDLEILSGIGFHNHRPDRPYEGMEITFSLTIQPTTDEHDPVINATFEICSLPVDMCDGPLRLKLSATGSIRIVLGEPSMSVLPPRQPSKSETTAADPDAFYAMMEETGLHYKGPFRALTSIRRRFEHSSATLSRFLRNDTTTLTTSPATLDACFHAAFSAYAAPGDGSLWTSFLPTRIGLIRFNLAVFKNIATIDPEATLTVDVDMARCTPPTAASKAAMAFNIGVFNAAGEAEIQVEDLVVQAMANTGPNDDREMYLHTVMDVDPTDEIICLDDAVSHDDDALLAANCRRISVFCLENHSPGTPRADDAEPLAEQLNGTLYFSSAISKKELVSDTQESIEKMIRNSRHADYLNQLVSAGKLDPTRVSEMLPFIEKEAQQVSRFRGHVGRILKQIVHRYPGMNILHLTTAQTGLSRSVMAAIGDAFQSLTVAVSPGGTSPRGKEPVTGSNDGIREREINLKGEFGEQLGTSVPVDLVILPTTLLENYDSTMILGNISKVMRPGGFLLLVNPQTSLLGAKSGTPSGYRQSPPPTPPHWQDVLDTCGFVQQARESDQYYSAGSVLVRQFRESTQTRVPSTSEGSGPITDALLLLRGVSGKDDSELAAALLGQLSPHCGHVTTLSLDDATTQDLKSCTAVVVLADLDEPLMPNMTDHRINQLRTLLRPGLTALWATRDARSGNPDHAASFGFLRTIAAEVPALKLQVVDLDPHDATPAADLLAAAFLRLFEADKHTEGNPMSGLEPEIHIENGRRLIPRVVPWKPGNDRYNALRRPVTSPVDAIAKPVELVPVEAASDDSFRFEIRGEEKGVCEPAQDGVVIKVEYSSALPMMLSRDISGYVCVGVEYKTGERMIALSDKNASYITCPPSHVITLPGNAPSSLTLLHQFTRHIAALATKSMALRGDPIVLVAPDVEYAKYLVDVDPSSNHNVVIVEPCSDQDTPSLYTAIVSDESGRCALLRPHPRSSKRDLKELLPRHGSVFNFLSEDDDLSRGIAASVSRHRTHSGLVVSSLEARMREDDDPAIQSALESALSLVTKKTDDARESISAISLSQIQSHSGSVPPFQLVDWRGDDNAARTIGHTVDAPRLSPDKTYYLFGITRDLGQSLCRLFLDRGARHIILASRNPTSSPRWTAELSAAYDGAAIRIERADVTSLDSLEALRHRVAETGMPHTVGGVVNGAMVLEDRAWAQMTADTWDRVLRPKTLGSANLDRVFGGDDLDFFIMTSSFAAVGGHPGQSNYAAANMYMNGLAAARRRRRRGQAGSALNIGVIYGLGFLHREREHLYAGLAREGYPPISERDLHHMFLEAIAAGRPGSGGGPHDITTGLRRYRRGAPDPQHWQLDPRFGHLAARDGADSDSGVAAEARESFQETLAGLEQADAVADAIAAALVPRLQVLLGLPDGAIDCRAGPRDLGLDSIIAVHVRSWFITNIGGDFALMRILDAPSIRKLCLDCAAQYLRNRAETKRLGAPN